MKTSGIIYLSSWLKAEYYFNKDGNLISSIDVEVVTSNIVSLNEGASKGKTNNDFETLELDSFREARLDRSNSASRQERTPPKIASWEDKYSLDRRDVVGEKSKNEVTKKSPKSYKNSNNLKRGKRKVIKEKSQNSLSSSNALSASLKQDFIVRFAIAFIAGVIVFGVIFLQYWS